jgi:hypothetical protein
VLEEEPTLLEVLRDILQSIVTAHVEQLMVEQAVFETVRIFPRRNGGAKHQDKVLYKVVAFVCFWEPGV